jgi:dTMP kinase
MFIVFEVIDGCGKTTQIWKLAKYLSDINKHNHLIITREPYKELEIRKILMHDDDAESQKEKLTQLFIEDRKNHINELITPSTKKGFIVISDRYKYSTIAYQSAQGQDINKLIQAQKDFLKPDFIFIIDTATETAIHRMKTDSRKVEQKFEKNIAFLEKTRQNYLKLKHLLPGENIIYINGNQTIDEIFDKIKS